MPKRNRGVFALVSLLAAVSLSASAFSALQAAGQTAEADRQASTSPAAPRQSGGVARQVRVMDFTSLGAPTTIIFRYTSLATGAGGEAEIEPGKGVIKIQASFTNLPPASRLGAAYLTYVLWSVNPEGLTTNLGEVEIAGTDGRLNTKVRSRRFGLIVTAEPYFAVSRPGKAVVFEADRDPATAPGVMVTEASCDLLPESIGAVSGPAAPLPSGDPGVSLMLEEGRRAIAAAEQAGAEEYSPDTLATARQILHLAVDQQASGVKIKDVMDTASEVVFVAEDARVLAVARRKRAEDTQKDVASP